MLTKLLLVRKKVSKAHVSGYRVSVRKRVNNVGKCLGNNVGRHWQGVGECEVTIQRTNTSRRTEIFCVDGWLGGGCLATQRRYWKIFTIIREITGRNASSVAPFRHGHILRIGQRSMISSSIVTRITADNNRGGAED
jgi:hypothetical protein